MPGLESRATAGDHGALHRVLQLANVARPLVVIEQFHRPGRDRLQRAILFAGGARRKVARQRCNVVAPLAQRRHAQGHHIQSIIEIFAEGAGAHARREVAVGGGNHAHIHTQRFRPAHPLKLLLLQHAQELGLEIETHFGNFVEQERPAVGPFKGATVTFDCPRKGAALVPKEGTFN